MLRRSWGQPRRAVVDYRFGRRTLHLRQVQRSTISGSPASVAADASQHQFEPAGAVDFGAAPIEHRVGGAHVEPAQRRRWTGPAYLVAHDRDGVDSFAASGDT